MNALVKRNSPPFLPKKHSKLIFRHAAGVSPIPEPWNSWSLHLGFLYSFVLKPFPTQATISITVLTFKALDVLVPDCQNSGGLANWILPFFSKNSAFLIINIYSSQTVYQAATFPTMVWCEWHVSGVYDTFLLALACYWCPINFSCVPDIALVSATKLGCLWQVSSVPDTLEVSLRHQWSLSNMCFQP